MKFGRWLAKKWLKIGEVAVEIGDLGHNNGRGPSQNIGFDEGNVFGVIINVVWPAMGQKTGENRRKRLRESGSHCWRLQPWRG